jgi:hypothetical protein
MSEPTAATPAVDETLDRVRAWVDAEQGMTMDGDDRITVEGPPTIPLGVTIHDRDLTLTHRALERTASPERIAELRAIAADPGPGLDGKVVVTGDVAELTLSITVPRGRLGRHSFLGALHTLAGAVDSTGPTAAPPPIEPVIEPGPEDTRVLERVWVPSHVVPKGGLPTWPTPDGGSPSPVRLEARVELSIAESRGDWARVVGVNGWTGWLDRRRLEPLHRRSQSGLTAAKRPSAWSVRPLPLIGLFAVGISSVLPWLRGVDGSLTALEVPLAFLWDVTAAEPPHLGWLLLALAAAVAGLTMWGKGHLLFIPLGLVVLAVPMLFAAQVYRGLAEAGEAAGDAFGLIGIAPIVAFVAGLVLLASARGDA